MKSKVKRGLSIETLLSLKDIIKFYVNIVDWIIEIRTINAGSFIFIWHCSNHQNFKLYLYQKLKLTVLNWWKSNSLIIKLKSMIALMSETINIFKFVIYGFAGKLIDYLLFIMMFIFHFEY